MSKLVKLSFGAIMDVKHTPTYTYLAFHLPPEFDDEGRLINPAQYLCLSISKKEIPMFIENIQDTITP